MPVFANRAMWLCDFPLNSLVPSLPFLGDHDYPLAAAAPADGHRPDRSPSCHPAVSLTHCQDGHGAQWAPNPASDPSGSSKSPPEQPLSQRTL